MAKSKPAVESAPVEETLPAADAPATVVASAPAAVEAPPVEMTVVKLDRNGNTDVVTLETLVPTGSGKYTLGRVYKFAPR